MKMKAYEEVQSKNLPFFGNRNVGQLKLLAQEIVVSETPKKEKNLSIVAEMEDPNENLRLNEW